MCVYSRKGSSGRRADKRGYWSEKILKIGRSKDYKNIKDIVWIEWRGLKSNEEVRRYKRSEDCWSEKIQKILFGSGEKRSITGMWWELIF